MTLLWVGGWSLQAESEVLREQADNRVTFLSEVLERNWRTIKNNNVELEHFGYINCMKSNKEIWIPFRKKRKKVKKLISRHVLLHGQRSLVHGWMSRLQKVVEVFFGVFKFMFRAIYRTDSLVAWAVIKLASWKVGLKFHHPSTSFTIVHMKGWRRMGRWHVDL